MFHYAATSLATSTEERPIEARSAEEIALIESTLKFFQTLARHQATRGFDLAWTPQEYYAEQQSFLTNRQFVGRLKNGKIQIAEIKGLFSNLMALQFYMKQFQSRSAIQVNGPAELRI